MSYRNSFVQASQPRGASKLYRKPDWMYWYASLRGNAVAKGVWDYINPDDPSDLPVLTSSPPTPPMYEQILTAKNKPRLDAYSIATKRWDEIVAHAERARLAAGEDQPRAQPPRPDQPVLFGYADIKDEHSAALRQHTFLMSQWAFLSGNYSSIYEWITTNTDPNIINGANIEMMSNGKSGCQALLKILKRDLKPTDTSLKEQVRNSYRQSLRIAEQGNVDPVTWIREYKQICQFMSLYEIGGEGELATTDFLHAVSVHIAPPWASRMLTDHTSFTHMGRATPSLEDYVRMLEANLTRGDMEIESMTSGVYATLGGTSRQDGYQCPCRADATHSWSPENCDRLRLAVTGSLLGDIRGTQPPPSELKSISDRFHSAKYDDLRGHLSNLGWHLKNYIAPTEVAQRQGGSGRGGGNRSFRRGGQGGSARGGSAGSAGAAGRFPRNFICVVIDATSLERDLNIVGGVYSTFNFSRHPLSDCTLFDNCGAVHLVNSQDLLVPNSFVRSRGDVVEAGSSALPILGRGTRVLKGLLKGEDGSMMDLTLKNVAVVEGFHCNLVSEARLRDTGVWFCGLDCTLRFGPLEDSVVLKTLTRKHNLVFIEYKLISAYSNDQSVIPSSPAGILAYPTINRAVRQALRPSRDYLKPRSDSVEIWHERTGHAGPAVLKALVSRARNVTITGIPRVKCVDCARAHAHQVISRRPRDRRSPRPFWRVSWDLFFFERGYNGSVVALVMKDEFSGKLWVFCLTSKEGMVVFTVIRHFEAWVKRRFGVSICILKSDREASVIAVQEGSKTEFQRWADKEGIELELSPADVHEPNGGSEKAGQDMIEKSIKMRTSANLPERLWVETVKAACWLHNKLPQQAQGMISPDETLDNWFRGYFRWYDPQLVARITDDLRPNWSFAYVYGARAYPVMREREGGYSKKWFKTRPRAHIGYLVGYQASNIYRIWVPELDRVFISRNVTFDESTKYSPQLGREVGQPLEIIRRVIEQIEEKTPLQDAGGILWNLGLLEMDSEELGDVGVGATPVSAELGQSSVVSETPQQITGLLTPELTPEPAVRIRPGDVSDDNFAQGGMSAWTRNDPGAGNLIPDTNEWVLPLDTPREYAAGGSNNRIGLDGPYWQPVSADENAPVVESIGRRQPGEAEAAVPRRSARVRSRTAKKAEVREGVHAVWSNEETIGTLLSSMNGPEGPRRFAEFRDMYGPALYSPGESKEIDTILGVAQKSPELTKTVHAVIAASILGKHVKKLRSAPEVPRIHQSALTKNPRTWKQLETHPLGPQYKAGCVKEIENLESRGCWRLIDVADAKSKPIPLQWVFVPKIGADGFVASCRSRLVVRGDLQPVESIETTYAATLAARSFRIAMALCAYFDLEVRQFDVVNAFINAARSKDSVPVTCHTPDGFKVDGKYVEIDQALYGLRDSPALWYKEWTSTLERLGLVKCKEEPCIYFDKDRRVYVVFYVDDFLVLFRKEDEAFAAEIIKGIHATYDLREMESVDWFLGVRIIRDRKVGKLWLAHDTYIEKIAKKYGLDTGVTPSTPLPQMEFCKFDGEATAAFVKEFQEKVGSILYTAIMIRADVAFACSILSRYLTNPSPDHMEAANQCIRYLWGTRFLAIEYSASFKKSQMVFSDPEVTENVLIKTAEFLAASDASFADDIETRKSSQGSTVSMFGGLILWTANRQDTVTTSTTEAELLGVECLVKDIMALLRLFKELRLELDNPVNIFCDNQQTIRLIVGENERITTKLRHVDIHNMWLRQEHKKGSFNVSHLGTNQMPPDGLTKNLSRQKFEHFRALLNLADIRGMVESL